MSLFNISGCNFLALVFLSVLAPVYSCEIGVALLARESVTYIPEDSSTVQINCTVNATNDELAWSIRFTNSSSDRRFINQHSKDFLNRRGFFQLTKVTTEIYKTIQLLMNSTVGNNGTLIQCFYPGRATVVSQTTLFVDEIVPIGLKKHDVALLTANISWNSVQLIPSAALNSSTFSVVSKSTLFRQELQGTNHSIIFTAPEGAPSCEVYNFSVIATYDIIGTNYNGAGCSVSSSVLSTMLPTLPEIDGVESTLTHSLGKSSSGITMRINFMPARYCRLYPVIKYMLVMKGLTLNTTTEVENPAISVNDLPEDEILVFSILALNSFGSSSSNESTIYTTDVQLVKMTLSITTDVIKIQCDFIPGSNAQGCLAVMVEESGNTTMKLMRRNTLTARTCLTSFPSKDYQHVDLVAFDIESDGSIGTVEVPGYFEKTGDVACNERSGAAKVLPSTIVVFMFYAITM